MKRCAISGGFLQTVYYWIVTGLASLVSMIFYPCCVEGRENIPDVDGCIFASNHESNIDPVLIPVVSPRQIRFLAKDSLFRNSLMKGLISYGGGIPLKRASGDRGALGLVLESLKKGWPVLVFPQGTRGGQKIQPGIGFLAVKSGVPVIPIYIEGTAHVLPKGSCFPKRTPVRVVFGRPMVFSATDDYDRVANEIMQSVWALK